MEHFEMAKDKVLMGPERKSLVMSDEEKRTTAYHEAGHALVGALIGNLDPVHKISIIPRGQALGVTILLPSEDRLAISKEYAEGMIAFAMGGRAAAELIFNRQTTGAGDDINKATDIARKMVCNWGMSELLGPLAFGKKNEEVFLGREMGGSRNYSERVAEDIDKEIHRIVSTGYQKAMTILKDNREKLESLSEMLLIRETVDGGNIAAILAGEVLISEQERRDYFDVKQKKIDAKDAAAKKAREKRAAAAVANAAAAEDSSTSMTPVPQGT